MDVEDIMTRKVMTMNCHETVLEAFKKYRDFKVGCLVIKDNERCVVGIVTERDLIERTINIIPEEKEKTLLIDPKKTEIKEIMSSNIKTIHPFEKIETAVEIMEKYRIKKLPVVSDNNKLVGIISITDIALAVPELTGRVERFIQSWVCPSWEE
jgi:CBS domain-containing protein